MLEGIMSEVKQHPYTSISALGCFLFSSVAIPFLWANKASAGDVQGLTQQILNVQVESTRQIGEVKLTVRRESTSTELNNVRRELFDVDLRIHALERENINVDPLLYRRRDDLTASQRILEVKLNDLDRALQ